MKETARVIKIGRTIFKGRDRQTYCLGVFSGYMLCHFNYVDGASLQTYNTVLAMIEDGAPVTDVVEFLEATITSK